jgi:hypothetical protein
MQRALPVPHFHVVFTLPAELRELVREHEALLLDLLFASASETLLQLAADSKRLDGLLGISAVVHTWGRNLIFHPHLHCIVTGGGLCRDQSWVESSEKFLLPVKVLSGLFRGKFLDGLAKLFQQGKLAVDLRTPDRVAGLLNPAGFARLKNDLYGKEWVVYTKPPFKKPDALFRYLGLYTHRVAISNHRILDVDDDHVTFRTRDKKTCQLTPVEFIRRFVQHVLPRGFVKVRHFGLYAAGNVKCKLAAARAAIEGQAAPAQVPSPSPPIPAPDWRDFFRQLTGIDLGERPHCGARLISKPLTNPNQASRAPPAQPS